MSRDSVRWAATFVALTLAAVLFRADISFVISATFFAIFAMSWSFFTSYSGYLNLGHVIFIGMGGYTSAILNYHLDWPMPVSIVIGSIVGTLLGWLYLNPIHKRVSGLSFEMVSFLSIIALTNLVLSGYARPLTNGDLGLSPLDGIFSTLGFAIGIAALLCLFGYGYSRFLSSNSGKIVDFARESQDIVRTAGADPHRYTGRLLLLSGLLASTGGALYVHYSGAAVVSNTFELAFMIRIVVIAIIGGRFSLYGSIVGAYFVVFAGFLLKPVVSSHIEFLIIYGLGFAIYFLWPKGLISILEVAIRRVVPGRKSVQ